MSKILHIDTDDQIPNRILKDGTNKVKQLTDKAQNIAFTQSDPAKQPIYNHDGYYQFIGGTSQQINTNNDSLANLFIDNDRLSLLFEIPSGGGFDSIIKQY